MNAKAVARATVALVGLSACRLEAPGEAPPADSLGVVLPAAPGDASRVTPGDAGVATPGAVERLQTAPSGLIVPVVGVAPGDLVDTFDDARSEGRRHDAIDILAPRGTLVVAAAAGTVVRLFTSERGGLTVYILGEDRRTVFYYAHLDAYAPGLAAGQPVRAGRAVGTVGDTGNAVPGNTHLHFAIWRIHDPAQFWDGEAVNPYPLLGGR